MHVKLFLLTSILLICLGTVIIILVETTKPIVNDGENYGTFVNLTNTSCVYSRHLVGRLFFHECMKGQKTVYDLRYFFKDEDDGMLKASIIGVQMSQEVYSKVCNFSSSGKDFLK